MTHTPTLSLPECRAATSAPARLPRSLGGVLALDDFEALARQRLPRPIFGYVAGAAEDNASLRDNRAAFGDYGFKTRVLVDVSQRNQSVELFGRRYAAPFGVAPMGISALSAYRGDIVLARAGQAANIPAILSGTSLIPLEEVIEQAPGTWFQAYLPGDPARIDALVQRVARAGVETLVLTVDIPVSANRENNVRNGFSTPLRPSLALAYQGLTHPRWLLGVLLRTLLKHGMPHFENSFATRGAPIISASVLRDFSARDHLSWPHFDRIRRQWKGALIIKGILSAEDARQARLHGADGIIVSNHGGRQLDGAVSPLRVLPDIVDVAQDMTVMMDSGVRRGSDVLKALALGARCVFVGRPFNYAAAVAGEAGVAHACRLLYDEVDRNMAMLGVNNCSELHAGLLHRKA
ncbi:L-lactate dehydrogenase (cytochrome) [Pseudogulbenkiania sp. NH8B]|uniref:alpha-hydroxy acid oxidase n=1 Tax=Pseudogulbenkiania sp. (strain NH8B) TaxID=748280 RepID=UPI000227971F|nr:alpha-hydroxy acid oxidase [Pseudogulbenkiania sp. NH8B]BAK75533.1 L-lactate dehydrogenase (cytochrome) [Pseudogulbenkiania sp. NH8B]